jgi:hypothetical protein
MKQFIPMAVYIATALTLLLGVSIYAGGRVTFRTLDVHSPYGSIVAKQLLVPGTSPEEADELISAQVQRTDQTNAVSMPGINKSRRSQTRF